MYSAILTELGVAVMDGDACVKSHPFSRRSQEYLEVRAGKGSLSDLLPHLPQDVVETNDSGLLDILKRNSIDVRMMEESRMEEIQDEKPAVLVAAGFASNEHDALGKLREFALEISSARVAQVSETPDLHIIQAINALDETDRVANAMFGRLREWYGLHFPELENLVDGIMGYCKVVRAGRRQDMDAGTFAGAGFPDSKADMLNLVAKTSRGGDISDDNMQCIREMAGRVLDLYQARRSLEEHLEVQMRRAAPNLSAVMGTGVGARLLAKAGSLKRLSGMAASTIQVLGAEKALFRSIKTGSQPPKHGLIFQHAMVHRAPRWQRGKVARAVASKAAIAARMDMHEPVLNDTLLEKLNVRVEEIGKRYAEPPQKPPARQGGHEPRRGGTFRDGRDAGRGAKRKRRADHATRAGRGGRKEPRRKRRFGKQ